MYCCQTLFSLDEQGIYTYFDNYGDENVMRFIIDKFSDKYENEGIDLQELDYESKKNIKNLLKREL